MSETKYWKTKTWKDLTHARSIAYQKWYNKIKKRGLESTDYTKSCECGMNHLHLKEFTTHTYYCYECNKRYRIK